MWPCCICSGAPRREPVSRKSTEKSATDWAPWCRLLRPLIVSDPEFPRLKTLRSSWVNASGGTHGRESVSLILGNPTKEKCWKVCHEDKEQSGNEWASQRSLYAGWFQTSCSWELGEVGQVARRVWLVGAEVRWVKKCSADCETLLFQ